MTFTDQLYLRVSRAAFVVAFTFFVALRASAGTPMPTATPNPSPQPAPANNGSPNDSTSNGAPAAAHGRTVPTEKKQPVRITKFDKAPVIDGRLDDDVWKTAAVFKDFYQTSPGDNVAPSKPTETMIGYDAKTLYIAFHCFDEPDKVRATVAKRDDVLNGTEDSIRVLLDTFNDQRKAYVLAFNPLGIQMDGVRTEGVNVDFSVDIVMQSKGTLTEDGYVVEVAIPFKSLRYEAGKGKQWGIQIFRIIQRFNGEQDSWMPISRDINGLLNQAGHITGLDGISAERTLELIPSITVSETGKLLPHFNFIPNDPGRLVNEPIKFDLGLTAKYTLTPTSTVNLAINPDFAQVEADATVVTTNQRFPIFYQEKRPFFLEGIDMFQLPLNVVHTRTIINPLVAAKLVGKTGRNSYGLMFAADRGPGTYTGDDRLDPFNFPLLDKQAYVGVLRLKRDIGKENSIGMVATSYNFPEKHNQIAGIDGRFKLDPQTTFTFHVVGTTSNRYFRDPEFDIGTCANLTGRDRVFCRRQQVYRTGNGFGYLGQYTKAGRHLFMQASAFGRTGDFRSDVGFVRRTNTNENDFYVSWNSTPKQKARFVSWNVESFNQVLYDWDGRIQGAQNGGHVFFNFQKQTFIGGGFDDRYEKDYEEEFGTSRNAPCVNYTDPTRACHAAFFGEPARASFNKVWFFGGGTTPNKTYSMQAFANFGYGAMDYDFGGEPKFPRISPAAILTRELIATGQCKAPAPGDPDKRSPLCFGPLDPGPGRALDINASFSYKPTNELSLSLNYTKSRLRRYDTGLVAFDDNIYTLRGTYQFTRFTFARARVDYDSLNSNVRGQFLLGWTPNPGTAFYAGYNDDLNRNGYNPFTGDLEQGFRRNGRTFFVKFSYLIRKSFG